MKNQEQLLPDINDEIVTSNYGYLEPGINGIIIHKEYDKNLDKMLYVIEFEEYVVGANGASQWGEAGYCHWLTDEEFLLIEDNEDEEKLIKEVKHIVNTLYRIKEIDRKKTYSHLELRKIILQTSYGQQVAQELRNKGITKEWLMHNNQIRLANIFWNEL